MKSQAIVIAEKSMTKVFDSEKRKKSVKDEQS